MRKVVVREDYVPGGEGNDIFLVDRELLRRKSLAQVPERTGDVLFIDCDVLQPRTTPPSSPAIRAIMEAWEPLAQGRGTTSQFLHDFLLRCAPTQPPPPHPFSRCHGCLVDAWTFQAGNAREQLRASDPLLQRMAPLMQVRPPLGTHNEDNISPNMPEEGDQGARGGRGRALEGVLSALPTFSRRYGLGSAGMFASYVNDELGSAFRHSESPNFQVIHFVRVTLRVGVGSGQSEKWWFVVWMLFPLLVGVPCGGLGIGRGGIGGIQAVPFVCNTEENISRNAMKDHARLFDEHCMRAEGISNVA